MATTRKSIPATVKQPEDHKEPAEAPRDVTVEWYGATYTVEAAAFGDYRTFRLLSKVEKNPAVIPDILDRLLGEDQHEALIDATEDDGGHVSTERIGEFLKALFEAAGQGNS
jgi:hypothetical protein